MDWRQHYRSRTVSAEEAVGVVRSGDRVVVPIGGETPLLLEALARRKNEISGVTIVICAPFADVGWYGPGWAECFAVEIEVFGTPLCRPALQDRHLDYAPRLFSLNAKASREERAEAQPVDIVLFPVSAPDADGYCNFGPSVWNKPSYARRARKVIVEVNTTLIQTCGPCRIHVSEIDYFVPFDAPPRPRVAPVIDERIAAIAGYIKEIIRDGDTIEIGTGTATVPLALLGVFDERNDLGWHSEITVTGIPDLVRRGIFNGRRKTLNPNMAVTTALSGLDEAEMAFVHENPAFDLHEVDYVNDIRTIAAHDNMVAINNAISVDLTGQTASESVGTVMWSGSGGQPEFAVGALMSKGGRSIIVLPSTTGDGYISRIVPMLEPGTVVTVPRTFADIVITEHGVARLLDRSQRQRAEALIEIAHPDHRPDLRKAARKLFWP